MICSGAADVLPKWDAQDYLVSVDDALGGVSKQCANFSANSEVCKGGAKNGCITSFLFLVALQIEGALRH